MNPVLSPTLAFRLLAAVGLLAACRGADAPARQPDSTDAVPVLVASYSDSSVPAGPLGASIRRGLALIEHTPDSLPGYAGSGLRCTSCHLDRGLRANAAPLAGSYRRFPKYLERSDAVVPIEDRVNYCFTRSLAGRAIPPRSREMVDIVAYLAFISRRAGADGHVQGQGLPKMPALTGDTAQGRTLFVASCARCHGPDGAGAAAVPALWGSRSFSIGASMARIERAASFVRHNMPFDKPGTLTDQQAFDVAAFVDSHARPDSPGKELDWPQGGAPVDVPYFTKGHVPSTTTPVLSRASAAGATVPAPAPAERRPGA